MLVQEHHNRTKYVEKISAKIILQYSFTESQ